MAKTLLQLQTSLAYRLDEDSVPSNTAEVAKRLSFINQGYNDVMRRRLWWFAEASTTFNSVATQASYSTSDGVPTNLRTIIELRFNGRPFTQITQEEAIKSPNIPYSGYSESYFIFAGLLYFVPPIASSVTNGIAIKYYKTHTELASNSDTVLIPDQFADILVAYAYARTIGKEGERGSAGDGFAEYTEILRLMNEEQSSYLFSMKSSGDTLTAEYP